MKTSYICLLILTISTSSFAQKALKLNAHLQYQAFDYSNTRNSITILSEESDLSVLPSPTISIYNAQGGFHEIGISRFRFGIDENKTTQSNASNSTITSGIKTTYFAIGIRYDYNIKLAKKESSISPYIGVSTSLGYDLETNEPKISNSFKRNEYNLGTNVGIVPRLIWKLNSLVFIDLNIPINIFRVEYRHQKIHNPNLPLEQQKNGGFETTFLPKNYEVRLGVGVFLFKGDKD